MPLLSYFFQTFCSVLSCVFCQITHIYIFSFVAGSCRCYFLVLDAFVSLIFGSFCLPDLNQFVLHDNSFTLYWCCCFWCFFCSFRMFAFLLVINTVCMFCVCSFGFLRCCLVNLGRCILAYTFILYRKPCVSPQFLSIIPCEHTETIPANLMFSCCDHTV